MQMRIFKIKERHIFIFTQIYVYTHLFIKSDPTWKVILIKQDQINVEILVR